MVLCLHKLYMLQYTCMSNTPIWSKTLQSKPTTQQHSKTDSKRFNMIILDSQMHLGTHEIPSNNHAKQEN